MRITAIHCQKKFDPPLSEPADEHHPLPLSSSANNESQSSSQIFLTVFLYVNPVRSANVNTVLSVQMMVLAKDKERIRGHKRWQNNTYCTRQSARCTKKCCQSQKGHAPHVPMMQMLGCQESASLLRYVFAMVIHLLA
jgi:hypothetical protein